MASANFRFKQFTEWHDRCAMKVGTDGVLLGAWCPLDYYPTHDSTYRILDIGTGSGLIALMLAQRLNDLEQEAKGERREVWIDAIDIEESAVEQAADNFRLSPWAEILHAHLSTLQAWKGTTPESQGYDLIVSNPPYFQDSLKNPNAQRATARHTDTLSYADLMAHATRLLNKNGILALILPIEAENEIRTLATKNGLYPTHITHVYPKPNKPAKRLLIAFEHKKSSEEIHTDTFFIESECAPRSIEYQALTHDFYL